MSRKILCRQCKDTLESLANKYSELFEWQEGNAKSKMMCDDCGIEIAPDTTCFASCLLPNNIHPNYNIQKPSVWAELYLFSKK